MLVLVAQLCHVFGALIYKAYWRAVDTRWMVFWAMIVKTFGLFLDYLFACRYNLVWGIPDLIFLFFTDIVFSTFSYTLFILPVMALFGKITPPRIEGTVFAFLTGTMNLSHSFIMPAMGALINK